MFLYFSSTFYQQMRPFTVYVFYRDLRELFSVLITLIIAGYGFPGRTVGLLRSLFALLIYDC